MEKGMAIFRLMRPANIVTSVADILAGIAISGYFFQAGADEWLPVILLSLATTGLYGGGIVFNDVFDADLDKIERPERPIPSGIVSLKEASLLGVFLLLFGITCALWVNILSGFLAVLIAAFALIYDKWGKHNTFLGPINMGICRGLNLVLGMSITMEIGAVSWDSYLDWTRVSTILNTAWWVFFIPVMYIASITMISRGEVHGGSKKSLYFAAFLYVLVISFIAFFSYTKDNLLLTSGLLIIFGWMIFNPLIKAIREPVGKNIGKAVKAGVISLILMDAAWATASGAIYISLIIVLLLPISLYLAKIFAVT